MTTPTPDKAQPLHLCCGTPFVALAAACEESSCTHVCPACGRHWASEEWQDDRVRLV